MSMNSSRHGSPSGNGNHRRCHREVRTAIIMTLGIAALFHLDDTIIGFQAVNAASSSSSWQTTNHDTIRRAASSSMEHPTIPSSISSESNVQYQQSIKPELELQLMEEEDTSNDDDDDDVNGSDDVSLEPIVNREEWKYDSLQSPNSGTKRQRRRTTMYSWRNIHPLGKDPDKENANGATATANANAAVNTNANVIGGVVEPVNTNDKVIGGGVEPENVGIGSVVVIGGVEVTIKATDTDATDVTDLNAHADADADDDDFIANTGMPKNNPSIQSPKSTRWYTLSYYISATSILYDTIMGILLGILVSLLLATCYRYTYYCCLVRWGLVPDDRLEDSLLNTLARRRKRIKVPNRWGRGRKSKSDGTHKEGCCSYFACYCWGRGGSGGYDGKGFFLPIDAKHPNDDGCGSGDDDDSSTCTTDEEKDGHYGKYIYKKSDDDSSDLSDDSVLTLEYGDEHLHDEYGEVTNRLNDDKVEIAAKEYFGREEQESAKKQIITGRAATRAKKKLSKRNKKSKRRIRGGKSIRSRRSCRSERSRQSGRSSVRSQTSSILESDSEYSSSSSSESDGGDTLEMVGAMADLKKVEENLIKNVEFV